ncbi:MAG: methyltransferase domain-containing protein [Nitrospinae bacterium]|nr:methyltransferase domain-containing protein [Nitrospinota bacterium]
MRSSIEKSKVRRGFDFGAAYYDQTARFQDEMAADLARRFLAKSGDMSTVLDLGCGAGGVLARLALSCRGLVCAGADISSGMLKKAHGKIKGTEGFAAIQADAESLPFKSGSMDAVVSNLMFQWLPDPARGFKQVAGVLRQGGLLMMNTLGPETFMEIRESLSAAMGSARIPSSDGMFHPFPPVEELRQNAESAGFGDMEIGSRQSRRYYQDIHTLLRSLKKQGVQNSAGLSSMGLGRRRIMTLFAEEYTRRFGSAQGVRVTYEVIHLAARKA